MSIKQMDSSDIIKVFNQYKDDSRMHTELLRTGCIERTKIICHELIAKGEEVPFLVVPLIGQGYSDEEVSCEARLMSGKKHTFKWTNHYVPFVFNEYNQKIVLDVCLMDGPETLENWCQHIKFQGRTLSPKNCILNHPANVGCLDMILRYQNPVERIATFASPVAEDNIVPNQVVSKWIRQVNGENPLVVKEKVRE